MPWVAMVKSHAGNASNKRDFASANKDSFPPPHSTFSSSSFNHPPHKYHTSLNRTNLRSPHIRIEQTAIQQVAYIRTSRQSRPCSPTFASVTHLHPLRGYSPNPSTLQSPACVQCLCIRPTRTLLTSNRRRCSNHSVYRGDLAAAATKGITADSRDLKELATNCRRV